MINRLMPQNIVYIMVAVIFTFNCAKILSIKKFDTVNPVYLQRLSMFGSMHTMVRQSTVQTNFRELIYIQLPSEKKTMRHKVL